MVESGDNTQSRSKTKSVEWAAHSRRGAYLALAAAVLFGASAPLAKSLLATVSPQLLTGVLYLGSGLGLAMFRVLRPTRVEALLDRDDFAWLAGAIVLVGIVGPVLLMIGLTKTPASGASLLLNLEGVFTACLAWFVSRER